MGKLDFWFLLGGFSPGDPENRIRGAILRILVVGELRGVTFKLFYAELRENLLSLLLLLAPTISMVLTNDHSYDTSHMTRLT